jgi:hypothetical protein
MEGVRLLIDWLGLPVYHAYTQERLTNGPPCPWYKINYELQRLSILLNVHEIDIIDFFDSLNKKNF